MNPFYKIKNWSIDKWDDYQDTQKILAHEYCGIRLIYNERYEQLFNDKVDFNYFAGDRN